MKKPLSITGNSYHRNSCIVKSFILETRNVNDVYMYVWLIHSHIKRSKKMQCVKGIILNVQNLQ